MGDITKIEWTDSSFNPWIGCQHVCRGAKHLPQMGRRWKLGAEGGTPADIRCLLAQPPAMEFG
jgi:protein gp37